MTERSQVTNREEAVEFIAGQAVQILLSKEGVCLTCAETIRAEASAVFVKIHGADHIGPFCRMLCRAMHEKTVVRQAVGA
ncbi:MAG: hypothetical protein NTV48_03545 [Candidatus Vogelbacteria bacterium]|nr:hypothetical protein [Candidatus Vogelbacteria bacterium]